MSIGTWTARTTFVGWMGDKPITLYAQWPGNPDLSSFHTRLLADDPIWVKARFFMAPINPFIADGTMDIWSVAGAHEAGVIRSRNHPDELAYGMALARSLTKRGIAHFSQKG